MACRYYHKKHTNRTEIYDVLKKVFSVLKFIGVGEEGGVHALCAMLVTQVLDRVPLRT